MVKPVVRYSGSAALLRSAALAWAVIGAGLMPQPVYAQTAMQQPGAKSAGMKLNDALGQLARNPQDLEALIAAGRASLDLGDVAAAIGFFQRADSLWPGSARIKSGLAGAHALGADPITAIGLFSDAEKLGPIDAERLADRGLAYDLVGDGPTAQIYYRQSLTLAPTDETQRRMALSQAIAGNRRAMEVALSPLLQRQDKAAWRTRAFALAILGQADEAESIVHQTMPEAMANSMTAYLRYMPRLTPAQQAAAANLGQFPRAAEIGHDDPRFARPRAILAAATPVPPLGKSDSKGKPKSKDKDKDKPKNGDKNPQLALASPPPLAVPNPPVSREVEGRPVQLAKSTPVPPAPTPVPTPRPTAVPAPVARPIAAVDPAPTRPAETFILPSHSKPSAQAPSKSVGKTAVGESIDEAFADFTPPSREVEPQVGAVDLRRLNRTAKPAAEPLAVKDPDKVKPGDKTKPADKSKANDKTKDKDKTKEKDKAKDAKLAQPSRVWAQVATGRDKAALGSDWRRLVKNDAAVFKGKKPFVTVWGQSNRLLTGPFESQKEAATFLAALKKAGVTGAFAWSSAAGQIVEPLGAAK